MYLESYVEETHGQTVPQPVPWAYFTYQLY